MKNLAFICLFLSSFLNLKAQMVADTFGNFQVSTYANGPMFQNSTAKGMSDSILTNILFKQNELAAKGILPGMSIYGIGFYKNNATSITSAAIGNFQIYYRCGNTDTQLTTTSGIRFNLMNSGQFNQGFSNCNSFSTNSNLTIPNTQAWIPLMNDAPFLYTGGNLEIATKWTFQANGSPVNDISFAMQSVYGTYSKSNLSTYLFSRCTNGNFLNNTISSYRPTTIIYHDVSQVNCAFNLSAGNIKSINQICPNKKNFLFLDGPTGTIQWQKKLITSSNWTNIPDATSALIMDTISSSTQYRCLVSCGNNTFYSPIHTINTFATYQIDSIITNVNGNTVSVSAAISGVGITPNYNWSLMGGLPNYSYSSNVQSTYNVDGYYVITLLSNGLCNNSSLSKTIYIGCPGATTFNNQVVSSNDSTCPDEIFTLSINDTIPSNYTINWYRNDPGIGYVNIGSGSSINTSISSERYFVNNATCTISGNTINATGKYVSVGNTPIVDSILSNYIAANTFQFGISWMTNDVKKYLWDFGDGDTSSLLNPIHHYNNAGNYTVRFIATNFGIGCNDTAYTQILITTNVGNDYEPKPLALVFNNNNQTLDIFNMQFTNMDIVDMMGKQLFKNVSLSANKVNSIDVSNLPNGIYIAVLKSTNVQKSLRQKWIKM